jgi:hypothetical protein
MNFKSSRGYILLEILIAVIVVLGLSLWWIRLQVHDNKKTMAKVMTQQIHEILNATLNYYGHDDLTDWPPTITIDELIHDKYLLKNDKVNPFGYRYKLKAIPDENILELRTKVSYTDAYVAQEAITPLNDAHVSVPDQSHGFATIKVKVPEPASLNHLSPNVVKFYKTVTNADYVAKSNISCPINYKKVIITTQKDCKRCVAYARGNFWDSGWYVYLKRMTRSGWSNVPFGQIQVSLTCQRVF